ncbi:hypothetical protein FCM35_KLT14152 [Carex littledalei]|uniref:Uncharacterized protein n=1 Tax=Carex littledalei TaxID=544730 RepID=A0A833QLE8_9POAL|nr:hypothetical protein FCM35_KLT14152 [Carex littledalei]
MSDRNTMAQVGAGVVEPPGKRDEQMAPPKKRNKRQPKRRSNMEMDFITRNMLGSWISASVP